MASRQFDPRTPDELHRATERHHDQLHEHDERLEQRRFSALFVAPQDQALIDATLADNECVHGNLPDDPGLLCDCWDRPENRRTMVPVEPFQERFKQMEPAVCEGHRTGGPGKQPMDAASAIAMRLGWFSRGKADGDRVRRTLGLRPTPGSRRNGKQYPTANRERIQRRTALQLCEAMGMSPTDVGL